MSNPQSSLPLIIYVDAADKAIYEDKDLWPSSGPNKPSNPEKFLAAMAYGYKMNKRLKIVRPDNSFARGEYFQGDFLALMCAVAAAAEHSLDVLLDGKAVASIAEEYAHGGITLLGQQANSLPPGTLWDEFESTLLARGPEEMSSRE